jgi:hypothetical protein
MTGAGDRVKLLRPGRGFEYLAALAERDHIVPVAVNNEQRGPDVSDFFHDVLAGSEQRADREQRQGKARHRSDGHKRSFQDESRRLLPGSELHGHRGAK